MEKHTTVSLLSAVMAVLAAFDANAGVSLFSDYGQIQNVQKYSSNPFWTPNSPYNQRLPQPVYAQGADLNAGDCIKVVQSKVAVQCMARDNCRNTKLADIRPTIMIELSNLPGNNYVSACSGYIDSVFESYVQQYGSSLPNRGVAFPTATEPNQNLNDNGIQIKNPYQQTTPKWKSEYIERSNELAALQRENGAGTEHLEHNDFPATFNDLSFAARSQFANDDYAIYKDLDTYKGLKALDDEEWCNEHPTSKECLAYTEKITNCTDLFANVPHVVRAEWDDPKSAKRVCQVVQCEAGFRPHPETKDKCIENEGTDCTNEIPHATRAEIDANGQCIAQECQNGYKVSQDKLSCEPETGNCTPDATLANAKHAIEWNFDSNHKCVISKCEEGWQPETDGSACKDADEYYFMVINHNGLNYNEDFWCYSTCGVHTQGDDLNTKLLNPIFGKNYCASGNHKPLVDSIDQGETLRFTEQTTYDKIVNGLKNTIADQGNCDGGRVDDIDVYIYKRNTTTNPAVETKMDQITIDD